MILPLFDSHGNLNMVNVPEEILYLQTDGYGGLRFYSDRDELRAVKLIGEWSDLLSREGFMRVDRGTIVNLKKVSDFDPKLGILEIRTAEKRICIPTTELMLRQLKLAFPNKH